MGSRGRFFLTLILVVFCFFQSGCALLTVPLTLVKIPFSLLGKIMSIVDKLPKPPPGVFF